MMLILVSSTLFIMLLAGASSTRRMPERSTVSEAQNLTEQVMTLNLRCSEGSFVPSHGGKERYGVILEATKDYSAGAFPEEGLHPALKAAGWAIDYTFTADTPNGTAFAYRKDQVLCLFEISWSPGHVDFEGLTERQREELENVPHTYHVTVCVVGE